MQRCAWCTDDIDYLHYHDEEWGVPSHDPAHLFEMLILEGFQAGLSWITILKKRENFRQALLGFDARQLAIADEDWLDEQMHNPTIIRNRLKLQATRTNARAWLALPDPVTYIWSFTDGAPLIHHYNNAADIPIISPQAEAMSHSLKKSGFKFVGPTICQSYLQAIGCLMDHTTDCHRYAVLAQAAVS
ncbi:DNA-3-methyladenine glycosylase I [Alcaligenaceae bacterium CGII-47]|nr:DNA-3-methyladenine glycosylase I [Alcaligenaceae bacterium CGII-47]